MKDGLPVSHEDERHNLLIQDFAKAVEGLPQTDWGLPAIAFPSGAADSGLFQFGALSRHGRFRNLLVIRRPNIITPEDPDNSRTYILSRGRDDRSKNVSIRAIQGTRSVDEIIKSFIEIEGNDMKKWVYDKYEKGIIEGVEAENPNNETTGINSLDDLLSLLPDVEPTREDDSVNKLLGKELPELEALARRVESDRDELEPEVYGALLHIVGIVMQFKQAEAVRQFLGREIVGDDSLEKITKALGLFSNDNPPLGVINDLLLDVPELSER